MNWRRCVLACLKISDIIHWKDNKQLKKISLQKSKNAAHLNSPSSRFLKTFLEINLSTLMAIQMCPIILFFLSWVDFKCNLAFENYLDFFLNCSGTNHLFTCQSVQMSQTLCHLPTNISMKMYSSHWLSSSDRILVDYWNNINMLGFALI